MTQSRVVVGVCVLAMAAAAMGQVRGPAAAPKKEPLPAGGIDNVPVDTRVTRLLDFLEKEYITQLNKSRDRVSRSLLAISISRIPRDNATKNLLEMLKGDRDPLVRAVAWDCLLARPGMLTQDSYRQLLEQTFSLQEAGCIRGDLRVAALNLLGVSQPDRRSKELFVKIFNQTDSRMPEDDDVIAALGRCLGNWKSPDVIEYLVGRLTNLDEAFRAHRVLFAAGCPIGPDRVQFNLGDQACLQALSAETAAWWASARATMKEAKVSLEDAPWKKLQPHLIPGPLDYKSINPEDKRWRKDLELRAPTLRSFDIALCVDATGSMGPALAWLHRDVRKLLAGVGIISQEPRIGLTFYRDHGDEFVVKSAPLTGKVELLIQALGEMTAKGGDDVPEAVFEGLTDCMKANPWSTSGNSKRAIILVCDAPGHPDKQEECVGLCHRLREKLIKICAVKLMGPYAAPDLSAIDALATATNGWSLEGTMDELEHAKPRPSARQCVTGYTWSRPAEWNAPEAAARIGADPPAGGGLGGPSPYNGGAFRLGGSGASPPSYRPAANDPAKEGAFIPSPGPVGRRVLSTLLVDAISPQFADRVEPMVAVLWELLHEPSQEKQHPFGPVQPVRREPGERTPHPPTPPVKVKGPQER